MSGIRAFLGLSRDYLSLKPPGSYGGEKTNSPLSDLSNPPLPGPPPTTLAPEREHPSILSRAEVETYFGRFDWKEKGNGEIEILGDWVQKNIIQTNLPLLGKMHIHKLIEMPLLAIWDGIFHECKDAINVEDSKEGSGGCFNPRHLTFNPAKALSRHSWGIAQDVNPSTNTFGTKGDMDKRVIDVFERNGFFWGGNFSTPDPMHFEPTLALVQKLLARII